jgi:hypothetical protein
MDETLKPGSQEESTPDERRQRLREYFESDSVAEIFECEECGQECDADDASEAYPDLCQECGETRLEDESAELMKELMAAIEAWPDAERLDNLKTLIRFA